MKTLDEVIDDFEKACDLERRCEDCSGCLGQENGCPNDGAECVPDALHYLKEYREKSHKLDIGIAEKRRFFEQYGEEMQRIHEIEDEYHELKDWWSEEHAENVPLTWEELNSMEGMPVWIELLNHDMWDDTSHRVNSEWWVIGEVRKDDIILATYLDEMELFEDDLGVIWQAYRKERK